MNAYRKLQAENQRLREALKVAERGIQDLKDYAFSPKYVNYPAEPGIAPSDIVQRCVSLGFAVSEALGFCEPEPVKREHRCLSCGVFWDCLGCREHDRKSCTSDRPDGYWATCPDCRGKAGA